MKIVEKKVVDETAGETEGARRATGVSPGGAAAVRPVAVADAADTEVGVDAVDVNYVDYPSGGYRCPVCTTLPIPARSCENTCQRG